MKRQLVSIALIFVLSVVAWQFLSHTMKNRTDEKGGSMSDAVGDLWGGEHDQKAPIVSIQWREVKSEVMTDKEKIEYVKDKQHEEDLAAEREKRTARTIRVHDEEFIKITDRTFKRELELDSSRVLVDLNLDYRRKGLLWFSTYRVMFEAEYEITNPVDKEVSTTFSIPFSYSKAVYDDMGMTVNDQKGLEVSTSEGALQGRFLLPPGASRKIKVTYKTRGLDSWSYSLGDSARIVKNFSLVMRTDFDSIDFPRDSISPDSKRKSPGGWELTWQKSSLVSALKVGMVMPHRINPGPLAASMAGSAPVSLLFFFFVVFMFQCVKGLRIHPVHYFFLAASFFAFNLLFSYLVDHCDLILAFAISSMVSLALVIPYFARIVGVRFALVEAGLCQVVYQVVFSIAHFFEGFTGLTIAVGAILTLAIAMHATARIDWNARFGQQGRSDILPPNTSDRSA